MPSDSLNFHPIVIAAGVIFSVIGALATYFASREAAPQRIIYRGPRERTSIIPDPICSICLKQIIVTKERRLTCGHVFHTTCIRERNGTCPNCSTRIYRPNSAR